jgi:outer membrane protein assembly factor BamE (lipoprotein component of BamABCDE complex)
MTLTMNQNFLLCLATGLTLSAAPSFAQIPPDSPSTLNAPENRKTSEVSKTAVKTIPMERVAIKASQLYQGMTKTEVEKIMGKPTDTKTFPNPDFKLEILTYLREPIITKVSLIDGRMTGLTAQAKIVTDNSNVPPFARAVEIGMSRKALVKLLGKPFRSEPSQVSSITFERLTFRTKDNQQQATIIMKDGFVEAVNKKFEYSPQILSVVLPKEPSMPQNTSEAERIRIGMNPDQVVAIFGKPSEVQASPLLEEQQVTDWVYSSLKTNASTRFTFTNGVLTRFAFIPQSAESNAKN